MVLIDIAIGGLGFATISSATGTGLITLCSIWVFLYSLSLAPIGKRYPTPYFSADHLARLDSRRRDLLAAAPSKDCNGGCRHSVLDRHPLRE